MSVNIWAVIVGAIICMILGSVWYMPAVFGNAWMKALGKKKEELGNPGSAMIIATISSLVLAYVFAHFVSYTGATSVVGGLVVGFWAWLGFIVTTEALRTSFEGRSWTLFYLHVAYHLVEFLALGALFAVWR